MGCGNYENEGSEKCVDPTVQQVKPCRIVKSNGVISGKMPVIVGASVQQREKRPA
jgi:hypothetical protein